MTNSNFSNHRIKAIIFDCDGTLVDSEESHFFSWRRAMENFGGDLELEDYLTYAGKPGTRIATLLAEKIGYNCADQLFSQKREYFLEYLHQGLLPIEGTVDFARRLIKEKERLGLKLGVASATVKHEVVKNLEILGLTSGFDVVLSGHDDLTDYDDPEGVNKPKPYIYLHAAKLLGVSPAECVVIEDSSTGVMAGVNAGCITVAVPNTFTKHQNLSHATLQLETLSKIAVEDFFEMAATASAKQERTEAKKISLGT